MGGIGRIGTDNTRKKNQRNIMSAEPTESWEDLDWLHIEHEVFQLQRRVFRLSQENKRCAMHRLQNRLTNSFYARCLAVKKAAEDSKGRRTPGVDGVKDLTDNQKMALARSLNLSQRPKPVKRKRIPKPGSKETRPLGIPTMADRAHQHLIALALEPEWEARFTRSVFGFRKGRCQHDALINIRLNLRGKPKWVLDGDIEKFFDRLSHEAILKKLATFPAMTKAIGRILRAKIQDGEMASTPHEGTPQGGPLSPLLANIALHGLESDLETAFPPKRVIRGKRTNRTPRLIVYADDFVCLHDSREVIEEARSFISEWLKPLGLNLSPTKTRIVHTLDPVDGTRGFDFLGCHIQQFRVGRHQKASRIHTHIGPSKDSQTRIYHECAALVDKFRSNKKRNAERAEQRRRGRASHQEILIYLLNKKLKAWGEYYRHHNFKHEFSRLDYLLFKKLFRWVKRTHPNTSRRRLVDTFFNGGNPWTFKVQNPPSGREVELTRVDTLPKKIHIPIRGDQSFFNGDWTYWGARKGEYPGLPKIVGTCLKRQRGRCRGCQERLTTHDRVAVTKETGPKGRPVTRLLHRECAHRFPEASVRDPFRRDVVGSPVHGDMHAGFRTTTSQ